jgi:hypothetical protein
VHKTVLLLAVVLAVAAVAPAMVQAATVAVYDDPTFVDTSDDTGAEADNVQASLVSFGHTVKRFDGTSSDAFSRGLAGARLLVIPDLENADLSAVLDQNAIHTIRSYVSTGGGLIIFEADDTGRDEGFLNTVLRPELGHEPGWPGRVDFERRRDGLRRRAGHTPLQQLDRPA